MHPDIQKLLEVQKVDMQLARVRRDLDSVPAEQARREQELDKARQAANAAKEEHDRALIRSRESEKNIKSADDEIKKLQGRLNVVKNNAEYQATLFQIESVSKERGQLEEEGLVALEQLEGLAEAAEAAAKKLAEAEATFAEFQSKANELLAERQAEHDEIAKGRQGLVDGVPADLLEKYSTIFGVRDSMAVCAVEGEHCLGCYTSITPNDMARLQAGTSIVQCGSCQRMLYLPES